jgi:hypothetical protein
MSTNIASLTLSVWIAALGSAAALGYAVHRPLVAPDSFHGEQRLTWEKQPPGQSRSHAPKSSTLDLAAVVIRGGATNAVLQAPPAPPPFRDLSEMRCGAWQGLEQGAKSQEVRRCE